VERNASHPLADAVVKKAKESDCNLEPTTGFSSFGGKGVSARVLGEQILIGNRTLMAEQGVTFPPVTDETIKGFEDDGKTAILVAVAGNPAGIIAIADTIKETSPEAVSDLKKMGLSVAMITGDNRRTAEAVGRLVGIDRVIAEVLPDAKSQEVANLQGTGNVVAFVGDGINDAPALARSDVGIAIGSGTDVAIESGDLVLIKDDLLDAVAAVQLSRKVMSRIKQNIFWAFAYNAALIPVAAGVLYPFTGYTMRPELAALAMAASSVTVVSLSLLLKRYIPPARKERLRRTQDGN
jgi:Cu+-exporting ATPase